MDKDTAKEVKAFYLYLESLPYDEDRHTAIIELDICYYCGKMGKGECYCTRDD